VIKIQPTKKQKKSIFICIIISIIICIGAILLNILEPNRIHVFESKNPLIFPLIILFAGILLIMWGYSYQKSMNKAIKKDISQWKNK